MSHEIWGSVEFWQGATLGAALGLLLLAANCGALLWQQARLVRENGELKQRLAEALAQGGPAAGKGKRTMWG